MRDTAGELADRFHLLRLLQGCFRLLAFEDFGGDTDFKRFVQLAELILGLAALDDLKLGSADEPSVVDCDRRLTSQADEACLWRIRKAGGLAMSEEQPANDTAVARLDRHGEIAAHRKAAPRHTGMRRILPVARIKQAIVGAHNALAAESRCKNLGIARHRKPVEMFPVDTRQRVKHVTAAFTVIDIVEEGAEFGARQRYPGIDGDLCQAIDIEFGGNRRAGPVNDGEYCGFFPRLIQRDALPVLGKNLVRHFHRRAENAGYVDVIVP